MTKDQADKTVDLIMDMQSIIDMQNEEIEAMKDKCAKMESK